MHHKNREEDLIVCRVPHWIPIPTLMPPCTKPVQPAASQPVSQSTSQPGNQPSPANWLGLFARGCLTKCVCQWLFDQGRCDKAYSIPIYNVNTCRSNRNFPDCCPPSICHVHRRCTTMTIGVNHIHPFALLMTNQHLAQQNAIPHFWLRQILQQHSHTVRSCQQESPAWNQKKPLRCKELEPKLPHIKNNAALHL